MPITVTCPFCNRTGTVPDHAAGQKIKCACGQHVDCLIAPPIFEPSEADQAAFESPPELGQAPEPTEENPAMLPLPIAVIVAGVLCVLSCGGFFVWVFSTTAPPMNGPWPECEACIRWMRADSGYPESLEIVEWVSKGKSVDPAAAVIAVRFRGKNAAGAMQVWSFGIEVKNGSVVTVWDDAHPPHGRCWMNGSWHNNPAPRPPSIWRF